MKIDDLSDEWFCQLLRTCLLKALSVENESWLPLLNPGSICPQIFTRPAATYANLPPKETEPGLVRVDLNQDTMKKIKTRTKALIKRT